MANPSDRTQGAARILIVEDSATQLEELRFLLEEWGFSVVAATNGKEGLGAARENAIDLVISDIVMPEMDGHALCKALRADPTLQHLPVILLTSLADPLDAIRALEAGADNFICKPYDHRSLLARVQGVLANQEIRRGAPSEIGNDIFFGGKHFLITAERLQILDLLLSTYETAVDRNSELLRARDELRVSNEHLEARVAERTKALAIEIAGHERLEEALRESEAQSRSIFENTPDALLVVAADGRIREVNEAAIRRYGYSREEFQAMREDDLAARDLAGHTAERVRQAFEHGTPFEWRHRRKDDSEVHVEIRIGRFSFDGEPALLSSARDITERKRSEEAREKLEEQLRVSQKMEAIGSLAGGIAHDFNNLLSVILGYTAFVMEAAGEASPLNDDLLGVQKAAERAAALTRQLLAFSRKQILQPVELNLNQIVEGVEQMLRRILGEDIEFVEVLASDLGLALADPGQIEQVLMNLVVNARDAMPAGGKLTIRTANLEIDEATAAQRGADRPGTYVELAVSDTGCGMDEATRGRIFEPFFTTKEIGKGTGLGLSTVYGIVHQSGGSIEVDSEPGQGTTFRVWLPRVSATSKVEAEPTATPTQLTGTETILVVDDEEALRKLAARILRAAGYTVLTAADGDDALLISAQHAGEIELLLTDVVMPRMSGSELAQKLATNRVALKVLYMSGYTDDAIVHHGVLDGGARFVCKPFSAADLTRRVREVLTSGITDHAGGHEPAAKVDVF